MTALTLSFQGHIPGTLVSNPGRHANFCSILVRDFGNLILQPLRIVNKGGMAGLSLGWGAQIDLDHPVSSFELALSCFSIRGSIDVFNSSGILLTTIPIDDSDRVQYEGPDIRRIYINSPSNETTLLLMKVEGLESDLGLQTLFFDQQISLAEDLSDEVCAEIIFGETSVLRAPDNETQLSDGRAIIASIAFARYLKDPTRFAGRKRPTPEEKEDKSIAKHWSLCQKAAKEGRKLDPENCLHFVIWPIDKVGKAPAIDPKIKDSWPYQYSDKITMRYGPFKSYGLPPGDNIYIFKYCGVR